MTSPNLTRRHALLAGAGAAGAVALGRPSGAFAAPPARQRGKLPAEDIQKIIGAEGSVNQGVLSISLGRDDIGKVQGPQGVEFDSAFQINGDLTFEPLGSRHAFFNGDLALKASELNPVIDAIDANGLVFQAMHQHFFDLDPMVWFIHFRGKGENHALATAVRKVIDVTSTPLPQKAPSNPTTPLDAKKLAKTLHGTAEVGEEGVVTVTVDRTDRIVVDGIQVNPEANISTNIQFKPLAADGSRAAAAPDFSMTSREVDRVIPTMRAQGFEVGCLYNQETGESPQLYFSHMLATGDPQALAVAIRRGLDRTHSA